MSSEKNLTDVAKQVAEEEAGGAPRRIHLRDITAETSLDGDNVGSVLRKARLKSGEDLKSVSDKLRIRRPYLEALEENRHEDLPERPYAIGFVRTYATYLGLSTAAIVTQYKAETAIDAGLASGLEFPEIRQEARLPRGSLFVLAVLLGAGVYGAWLLSISADRMVTDRAPALSASSEIAVVSDEGLVVPEERSPRGLAGDSASAAANSGALPAVHQPVRPVEPSVAPVVEQVVEEGVAATPDAVETAALTPIEPAAENSAVVAPAASEPIADDLSLAVGGARVYGLENVGSRVVVRAAKQAWLRVEAGDGRVLLNETLEEGELYRAPLDNGAILVARDAGAFKLYVDGQDIGVAGPSGLVLTGKSLNPEDLLRR